MTDPELPQPKGLPIRDDLIPVRAAALPGEVPVVGPASYREKRFFDLADKVTDRVFAEAATLAGMFWVLLMTILAIIGLVGDKDPLDVLTFAIVPSLGALLTIVVAAMNRRRVEHKRAKDPDAGGAPRA